jgi:glycerol kinase
MLPVRCVAAIEISGSFSRVLITSGDGRSLGSHQLKQIEYRSAPDNIEYDPLEIWKNVKICMSTALKKVKEEVEIVGIGISNQRETTLIWDKETGIPYHPAIASTDARTETICDELKSTFGTADHFRAKTGLPIEPYFSATKIMYLLDSVPGLREDAEKGRALFGTIDSWLVWKLTHGQCHATDVTNASRTLLMNLETLQWDEEILKELNIPSLMLPTIRPSSYLFGRVDTTSYPSVAEYKIKNEEDVSYFKRYHNAPISGVLGDQQAALFGQICFNKGEAKCTYGTGAFLLMNTGHDIVQSKRGLLTTVAYQLGPKLGNKPVYALEGAIALNETALQWVKESVEITETVFTAEELANSVSDSAGVHFTPSIPVGLYSPYWKEGNRGIISGLAAHHSRAHIVRATLEASVFQITKIVQAMLEDTRSSLKVLKVSGGVAKNDFVMQLQSNLSGISLIRSINTTDTIAALGVAYIAGLEIGLWSSLDHIRLLWRKDKEWTARLPEEKRTDYVSEKKNKYIYFSVSFFSHFNFFCLFFPVRSLTGRKQ